MAPKARTCYICGRPTLLPGFDNHVVQCRDLFEKRESQKPAKERRACPADPMMSYYNSNSNSNSNSKNYSSSELDLINDASHKAWEQSLSQCRHCGRRFLPDKLAIHNRSCTAANPARRVEDKVGGGSGSGTGGGGVSYGTSSGMDASYGYGAPRPSSGSSSRKLSAGGMQMQQQQFANEFSPFDTPTYGHLIKCKDCGRNFNEVSFEKHSKICRKVFVQKRKQYDSAKHRAQGTDLAQYQGSNRRSGGSTKPSATSTMRAVSQQKADPRSAGTGRSEKGTLPKWKAESLSFRNAIRQARLVSQAEKQSKATGIPLHALLPPSSSYSMPDAVQSSYIQCQHCGRSFNEKAAERHIPKCQSIINKPSKLVKGSGIAAKNPYYSPPSKPSNHSDYGYEDLGSAISQPQRAARRSLDSDPVNIRGNAPNRYPSNANDINNFSSQGFGRDNGNSMVRQLSAGTRPSNAHANSYQIPPSAKNNMGDSMRNTMGQGVVKAADAPRNSAGASRNEQLMRNRQLSSGAYGAFTSGKQGKLY